jgi:hypothetical protein
MLNAARFAFLPVLIAVACGSAADAQTLSLKPADGPARTLTADEIAKLPHVQLTLSEHGAKAVYDGVPLSELTRMAGAPQGEALRGPALAQVVLVSAADGYRVALALAETDPAMRADRVVLADRRDGKPLDAHEGPFRLIVEGDKRPARSARNVISIELRPLP